MAEQGQQISKILADRNQARRQSDKVRRDSLTTEQKEEINARRREKDRAKRNSLPPKSLTTEEKEQINAVRRAKDKAKRNSLASEQKERINALRRAAEQRTSAERITDEKRARRRTNAAARRDTACPESIAMPCPNATILPTSTPEYTTIRTDGNTLIFKNLFISWCIKESYLPDQKICRRHGGLSQRYHGRKDHPKRPNGRGVLHVCP